MGATAPIRCSFYMRVLALTYGTRGDVQPYVALGAALVAAGHQCDICTHALFKSFVEEYGLGFVEYTGENPQTMFDYCVREGIFSWTFVREVPYVAHQWMDAWVKVCVKSFQTSYTRQGRCKTATAE